MIATPDMFTFLGNFELDHPEGVCVAPDGVVYAGGELGHFIAYSLMASTSSSPKQRVSSWDWH
jgi:hypothetical protein